MCFGSSRMASRKQVAVYDTKSNELRKVSLRVAEKCKYILKKTKKKWERKTNLLANLEVLEVPRFGKFDLYESNQDSEKPSHTIISQPSQVLSGSHLRARIKYGGLGPLSNTKRIFSSTYRQLRVGVLQ